MTAGARLQRLEESDLSVLSPAEVTAALRDVAVIRGTTDRLEAVLVRRVAELHEAGDAAPPADVLGRGGRMSRRAAEQVDRRAGALGRTPKLNDALGKGSVGAEHADAVAAAAGRLDDAQREALFEKDREITELAVSQPPEVFRRGLGRLIDEITADDGLERAARQEAAATASMKFDDDTGMHLLFAKLTPEQGNRLRRALDHEVAAIGKLSEFDGLRRDQLMVRALDRLVSGDASTRRMGPAEVAVLIDHQTLVDGVHERTVSEYSDGTQIPTETARRHACDARIIPVVLGGDSQPLDVGRARRLATPPQRTALRSMYRTCAIESCDHHFDRCHIHHLAEWDHLGATDLDNLVPLCSAHHHRVHEGRWRLQLDSSTRQLTVHLPDGTLHAQSLPDLLADRKSA